MEINIMQAMQTQPAQSRLGQRAGQPCAPTTDRSLVLPFATAAMAVVETHRGWNRARAAHTEGVTAFGMFSVLPTTVSTEGSDYAGTIDGQGDRLGSPAWSPPV